LRIQQPRHLLRPKQETALRDAGSEKHQPLPSPTRGEAAELLRRTNEYMDSEAEKLISY
jgi:hypothetical protein